MSNKFYMAMVLLFLGLISLIGIAVVGLVMQGNEADKEHYSSVDQLLIIVQNEFERAD